jgi:hypothetical protein
MLSKLDKNLKNLSSFDNIQQYILYNTDTWDIIGIVL